MEAWSCVLKPMYGTLWTLFIEFFFANGRWGVRGTESESRMGLVSLD